MRAYISGLIMTVSATAFGQLYTLPGTVFDKMAFEVSRGRSCDTLSSKQFMEIAKLQTELLAQSKIIQLKKNEVTHLEEIIALLQKESQADKTIAKEKIHSLKVKIRKLFAIVIGEAGVIVVLVLLL